MCIRDSACALYATRAAALAHLDEAGRRTLMATLVASLEKTPKSSRGRGESDEIDAAAADDDEISDADAAAAAVASASKPKPASASVRKTSTTTATTASDIPVDVGARMVALCDVLVAAGRVDDADFDATSRAVAATLASASRGVAVDASRAAVALAAACPSRAAELLARFVRDATNAANAAESSRTTSAVGGLSLIHISEPTRPY